ncbi:MAG TPA: hypothetical protein VNC78_10050 [Actinomycetota bacterium]|nr:hypothetical protein [Actinomycetota bacterium]
MEASYSVVLPTFACREEDALPRKEESGPSSHPTRPPELDAARWRREAWVRRALVALFLVPVLGAAFGLLGLSHDDVSSTSAGYELRVRYPKVSRGGLASAFDIYVRHEGGFDSPITLSIGQEYFTLFDLNGIFPAPSAETVDGDMVVWEFDPPEGDLLRVHVDWRVEPAVHAGAPGSVRLEIDGSPITQVEFETRLAP